MPDFLSNDDRESLDSAARSTNMSVSDLQMEAVYAQVEEIVGSIAHLIWKNGYKSGFSNAMRLMSDEPNAPMTPNPYER